MVSTVLQLASVQMAVGVEPCGDVHVIRASGSGAQLGDPAFQNFYVRDLSSRVGSGLAVSAYQLGQGSGYGGYQYPAVGDPWAFATAGGDWFPYNQSVDQGRHELAVSGDGSTVAFHSFATNLVLNDTNGVADVFVRGPEQ
ncbi:MAG: hypothetical protein ABI534_08975 [Chloroflexota bacterium]